MHVSKRLLFSVILILVTVFIILNVIKYYTQLPPNLPGSDLTKEQMSTLPDCGSEMHFYNVSPLASSDYSSLTPLGNSNPDTGHVAPADHMYMIIRTTDPNNKESPSVEAPIYSPGNVWLLRVDKIEGYNPAYSDYSLFFASCKDFSGELHHVTTVSKKIVDQLTKPEWCQKNRKQSYCIYYLKEQLMEGELIGTAGGNRKNGHALDLEAYDFRSQEAGFANKARYTNSQLHKVCPLEYYRAPVRSELFSRLASRDNSANRSCGAFMQDMPGTLQGTWIAKGKNTYYNEDYILVFLHENTDLSKPLISFGWKAFPSMDAMLLTFDKQASGNTNRDFSEVNNDDVYCYDNLRNLDGDNPVKISLLVQITQESTMRIKLLQSGTCGEGPWVMPKDAIEFER